MRSTVEARMSLTIQEGAVVALCPAKRGPHPVRAGRHLELPEPFLWLVFWGWASTLLYRQSSHASLTGQSWLVSWQQGQKYWLQSYIFRFDLWLLLPFHPRSTISWR